MSRARRRLALLAAASRTIALAVVAAALPGLAVVTALVATSPAHANGRAPATNGIHFRPGAPDSLYIASTFGLLVSHDGGCTLRWVCEQNLGYGGRWDPAYAVAADGTLYATTYTGLRISRDGGCSFTTATAELPAGAPGRIANRWIDALALGDDGALWVGTSDNGLPNDLFRSDDGGRTFTARGPALPTIFWKSVQLAARASDRIYATGYQLAGTAPDGSPLPPSAHAFRSDDAGATWQPLPLTGVSFGLTPIVAALAVAPQSADVVYLASRAANPPNGDRLYRSDDAGATFSFVLATAEPIHDVVHADAQNVVVATQSESGVGGSTFHSSDAGKTFARLPNAPRLACLGKAPDGSLYGCAANFGPDYMALTRSTDGAATFRRIWRFAELAGPVQCPAGTPQHDTCELEQWSGLQAQLAATGPTCGAPSIPDAGPDAPDPNASRGGCCQTSDGNHSPYDLAIAAIALFFSLRRPLLHRAHRGDQHARGQ